MINYLTHIHLGDGSLSLLPEECRRLGITRPMVVTDAGVRAAGLLDRLWGVLPVSPRAIVFDQTPSNPNEQAVHAAVSAYKDGHCDGLIALGGGSSIDLAKGVSLAATHPGPLHVYAAIENGAARISDDVVPLIAVPTTAGTGSEVGRAAVLIVDDGRKLGIVSPHLIPKSAICDPELTLGLPAGLTASTGMDAIAHCMETFMAPAFNPPADGIALDGLRRGWANIERAVREPADREARLNMMSASLQGALAFQKGLGCVHSLSHALGGFDPRLHHGTLNAMLLPAVIAFNAEAPTVREQDAMERMAQMMGLGSGADVGAAVRDMNARLALPAGLGALGITRASFPTIIEKALGDHCHRTNPRIAIAEDYEAMLEQSL